MEMTFVLLRQLQGAIRSLESSTDIFYYTGKTNVQISHRGSPYLSHKRVGYWSSPMALPWGVVVAANKHRVLGLCALRGMTWPDAETIQWMEGLTSLQWVSHWEAAWITPGLVTALLDEIIALGLGFSGAQALRGETIIIAGTFVPTVTGWNEKGKPILTPKSSAT